MTFMANKLSIKIPKKISSLFKSDELPGLFPMANINAANNFTASFTGL